jgi:uncharacterized protein (DUF2147 family)
MKTGLAWAAAAWLAIAPAYAAESDVRGLWRTPDRGGLIEITACGKGICGKVLGGESGDPLDSLNKDPALRGRSLIGMTLFSNLRPVGRTWKGRIYNPDDGNTYDVTLTPRSPTRMDVRGCIVWPLCRGKDWTRVKG